MRSLLLTSSLVALAIAAPARAQDAAPAPAPAADADKSGYNEIIVTGRAGTGELTKAQTSYSVTNIDEEKLRLQAPTSVTESLKSVPGFWVEASGGEASGNVRARGVPVDGFGSIQLLEDGMPVQHDPALGYLNADQAFRLDETIDRVEVVRGGPSALFYSNAPAGAVNYIPRQVGDTPEGLVKLSVGADSLYRADFWVGTPIGDGWKLAAGGFYRAEDGVRDPGFTGNQGGQIRATLSRDWSNGHFSLDVKRMDDKVIFYTGIPMTYDNDGNIVAVNGFSGHTGTVAGPETQLIKMIQGDGSTYTFDNTEGTHVKRTQISGKFDFEPADGWRVSEAMRYNDTWTQRNGVYPNSIQTAQSLLDSSSSLLSLVPGASALGLRYTTSGEMFDTANQNGNGLVIVGGLRGITMPVKEFMSDTRIAHKFDMGGTTHNVTFGYYYAHLDESFSRYSSTALLDVQDNARLLDLVGLDSTGKVISPITDNGIYRYGYEWEDAHGQQTTNALYLTDEWQITPALRIDAGVRWETMNTRGTVGLKSTVNLGTFATSNILTGSGVYANYDDTFSHATWTAGVNYQFNDRSGVFARYTYANRLPSLGNYVTNATATPYIQTMSLGEAGFKYASPLVEFYATGFWTRYNNVSFTNYIFDLNGSSTSQTLYADTQTFGLELEGTLRPTSWFDISGTATLQDPRYKGLTYTDNTGALNDFDGKRLIRVPITSLRVVPGFNLLDNRLRLQGSVEYEGARYVDTANSVKLPAYTTINLSASFAVNDRLTVYGYVDNVNNSLGLTEGNPRAGEVQNGEAGASVFIARPLLGRNFRASVLYKF
ncbi:outer membrane receptor protein involved in Fe transport [Novosphingobium sp. PhB165]|uniref:TonB-dependent receptor n=1 Tax=Novosphingobium sp. PhB165 TaxID=2485105 RepID=UPI0010EA7BED|nr:TonB-dependent receptor [Novosphingobium sp. PhB165]TCM16151.1 outer membrane receptor protein involved in Fe transport [Novosphingobium sp. PhB165]